MAETESAVMAATARLEAAVERLATAARRVERGLAPERAAALSARLDAAMARLRASLPEPDRSPTLEQDRPA